MKPISDIELGRLERIDFIILEADGTRFEINRVIARLRAAEAALADYYAGHVPPTYDRWLETAGR